MKTVNCLDQGDSTGSGLFFITSGEVRKAIGRTDPFKNVGDPAEAKRRLDDLSKTIEKEVNRELKTRLAPRKRRKTR